MTQTTCTYSPVRDHRGFTMIELMVTIAMLAILLGIGIPSFQSLIRSTQITSATNAIITGFAMARSEATKRGNVSICARAGNQCSGGTDWKAGWLVFTDPNLNGQLDADELLLNSSDGLNAGMTATSVAALNPGGSTTPAAAFVSFTSLGNTTGGVNTNSAQLQIYKQGCGKNEMRIVTIGSSGRSSLAKQDCP